MQPVMFPTSSYPTSASPPAFNDGLSFYSAGGVGGGSGTMQPTQSFSSNNNNNGGFDSSSNSDFSFSNDVSGSMGGGGGSGSSSPLVGSDGNDFDSEPPLLEELGINFRSIWTQTLAVSLPFRPMPVIAEDEADLAGPLVFCLLLGTCLLMTGKVHFGYIYGFGLVGCMLMYIILNLMGDEAISVDRTMSILGYSLLPIVLLAVFNIFFNLRGVIGLVLSLVVIVWCTLNATRLFEKALSMQEQRYLVAYPVTMLYACFALLTIF